MRAAESGSREIELLGQLESKEAEIAQLRATIAELNALLTNNEQAAERRHEEAKSEALSQFRDNQILQKKLGDMQQEMLEAIRDLAPKNAGTKQANNSNPKAANTSNPKSNNIAPHQQVVGLARANSDHTNQENINPSSTNPNKQASVGGLNAKYRASCLDTAESANSDDDLDFTPYRPNRPGRGRGGLSHVNKGPKRDYGSTRILQAQTDPFAQNLHNYNNLTSINPQNQRDQPTQLNPTSESQQSISPQNFADLSDFTQVRKKIRPQQNASSSNSDDNKQRNTDTRPNWAKVAASGLSAKRIKSFAAKALAPRTEPLEFVKVQFKIASSRKLKELRGKEVNLLLRGMTKALGIDRVVFDVSKIGNSVIEIIIPTKEEAQVLAILNDRQLEVITNLGCPDFASNNANTEKAMISRLASQYARAKLVRVRSCILRDLTPDMQKQVIARAGRTNLTEIANQLLMPNQLLTPTLPGPIQ